MLLYNLQTYCLHAVCRSTTGNCEALIQCGTNPFKYEVDSMFRRIDQINLSSSFYAKSVKYNVTKT